jgi:hypothetical protein
MDDSPTRRASQTPVRSDTLEVETSKVAKSVLKVMHRFRHSGNGMGSMALQAAVLKFFEQAKL